MQSLIRLAGLLILGLAFIVPSFAGDEKKGDKGKEVGKEVEKGKKVDLDDDKPVKKGKKKAKGDEETKEKVRYQQPFLAKLTQMDANSQKDFTVQVTQKVAEPNQGAQQRMLQLQQQLLQHQQSFARAQNFQQRQQALQNIQNVQFQMAQTQRDLVRFKDVTKDYKLRAAEDMKVRWKDPPPDYDDKGNLKKYTKEELKALKGDEGLPGYKGEPDALRQGQIIYVYLIRKTPPAKGGKGGKRVTEEDEVGVVQDRPEVGMIVILAEPKQQ